MFTVFENVSYYVILVTYFEFDAIITWISVPFRFYEKI